MKDLRTKKNVFFSSLLYILYFVGLVAIGLWCNKDWCHIREDDFPIKILYSFFPVAVVFFLTLITYRMKEEVFQSWLKVSYWMVPIIMLATVFVENIPQEHGFFSMDGLAYLIIIAPLYGIFILLSIWKIARTYISKRGE